MTITLQLAPEVEHRLKEEAARKGVTVDEYITQLVEQSAPVGRSVPALPPELRAAEWRAWAASHQALPHPADDDRESIYAGRGE